MVSFIMDLNQNPSWSMVVVHALDVVVPIIGIWLGYAYGKARKK